MKLLFLSYHFLGPLSPLAIWLADGRREILFASSRSASLQRPFFEGIKRVILKRYSAPAKRDSRLDILENILRAARNAENSFLAIRESGFRPDIAFTASSGGAALAIPSVFPETYWVNFLEPSSGQPPAEKDLFAQKLQISLAQKSFVFYPSQKGMFPKRQRLALETFQPVVNSDWFCPDSENREERLAVFINASNPYQLLRDFLAQSGSNRCIWIAGNAFAKKEISGLASSLPVERLAIIGRDDIRGLRQAFCKAQLAFYKFPCELALQAMACGCAVYADATVPEEDLPPQMRLVNGSGREISALLGDADNLRAYRQTCRAVIGEHYAARKICPDWFSRICREQERWKKGCSG